MRKLNIIMADGHTYDGSADAVSGDVLPRGLPHGGSGPDPDAGITPSSGQAAALEAVLALQAGQGFVIAGYAGVGKTTMLQLIARACGTPKVLTPTGKAALRVSEASGLPAETIHRWMYTPKEDPRTGKVKFVQKTRDLEIPSNRTLVVDEASMVGTSLWHDLWRAAQTCRLKVVLVGDAFQLPPVEPGKAGPDFSTMTADFAAKNGFGRVELTEILRQAADSPIVKASTLIRTRQPHDGFALLPRVQQAQLGDVAVATYTAGGVVITHTNAARFRVNYGMRQMLIGVDAAQRGPQVGEPLMCLRNNYDLDIYNGEQIAFGGWEMAPDAPLTVYDRYADAECPIRYGTARVDGRRCVIALEELSGDVGKLGGYALAQGAQKFCQLHGLRAETEDGHVPYLQVNYGYCYTAHKAQGSEWPYVLYLCEPSVKLSTEEGRRHAYTAITRAKTQAAVYFGRI